ncbi:SPOSA6832_02616 [Sporobolomyces salmonicolor]|uniref:SPOSA6832_02616-mRNA-1:cds n=1 Tax=Sporidiobolus salmonicolor TaxID=5005 RepID=A0A0D6ELT0_SPOSA|nr:SPOSA6832_02616 [Sporobolomyces salmonicolor]
MARHSKKRGDKNGPPKARTPSRNNASGGNYNVIQQTNPNFEAYYKAQKIVPDEEWDALLNAFRDPLPTTFRLTQSRPTARALNEHIKSVYVPFLTNIEHEGVMLSPPKELNWCALPPALYCDLAKLTTPSTLLRSSPPRQPFRRNRYPGQLAWQLPVPKSALRKIDAFKKFQHFLVYETDAGNLSRQEAVSMIPPLLLDVQPGHTALDMCAAPGSKSVQILEALHGPPVEGEGEGKAMTPQGLLIANDADAKRCHLLVHQSLHRVPGTGMMVTNHDATQLPSLRLPRGTPNALKFTADDEKRVAKLAKGEFEKSYEPMLFDRILADVPCSGDGTLRKNLGIWGDWTVGNGIGLHSARVRLVPPPPLLGAKLTLETIDDPDMAILPVPSDLPGLIRRPGLTTWRVLDNSLADAPHPSSAPDAAEADIEITTTDATTPAPKTRGKPKGGPNNQDKKGLRKTWLASLWPPAEEVAKSQGLEHSLRLYPHLQDTGAFFVCVLVKKGGEEKGAEKKEKKEDVAKRERASSPIEGQPEAKKARAEEEEKKAKVPEAAAEAAPAAEDKVAEDPKMAEEGEGQEKEQTMGAGRPFNEEPYIYLTGLADEQVQICKYGYRDFFDIAPSFPFDSLLVRNTAGAALRSIYLTSALTKSILLSNAYTRMRLISCGVKLFTRQDSSKDGTYACKWRINSEGLEVIRPYLGEKRIVKVGQEALRQLMENVSVKFDELKDEGIKERVLAMEPGSAVLRVEKAKGADTEAEEDLYLAFWISKTSCNLMVEKVEKSALSLRLYDEDITPHAKGKPAPTGPGTAAHSLTPKVAEELKAVEEEEGEKVEAVKKAEAEEVGEAAPAAQE